MDSMEIEEDSRQPVVVVVGVDFGTSRSGFAFSWLNDTSDTILKKNKFFLLKLNQKIPRFQRN
jgi:hypothetical protein